MDATDLWGRYHATRSDADRNALVEHYMPLVKTQARQVKERVADRVDLDDLVNAGVFGLMEAIGRFDPARNCKFESFAPLRIRGAMVDQIRAQDWVPRLVREQQTRLGRARTEMASRLGREPSDKELAAHLGLSDADFARLAADASTPRVESLFKDMPLTNGRKDGKKQLHEYLVDEATEPSAADQQRRDLLAMVLRGCGRKERLVILLYYFEGLTMKEIGAVIDLSESRISQMHSNLLARLRERLALRKDEFAYAEAV